MAPAKRRSSGVESQVKRRCQSIARAIKTADDLSDSCKAMLSGMSSFALETYESDRHSWQSAVVDMVTETVQSIEKGLISKNKARESDVSTVGEIKAARAAAVRAAEAALIARSEELTAKQTAADECLTAVKAAKAKVAAALKTQSSGDAELDKLTEKKMTLENCKASSFTPLKDGSLSAPADSRKATSNVANVGKHFGIENAMVQAALEAFKHPPADRSAFLLTSVSQMEEKLDSLINGLSSELSQGEPGKQERAAAVAAAESAKEAAVSAEKEAKANGVMAQNAKREAEATLKAAKKAVAKFYPDMKKMMDDFDMGPRLLKEFQDTVKADLCVLQTLAAPPAEEQQDESAQGDVAPDGAAPEA